MPGIPPTLTSFYTKTRSTKSLKFSRHYLPTNHASTLDKVNMSNSNITVAPMFKGNNALLYTSRSPEPYRQRYVLYLLTSALDQLDHKQREGIKMP